MERAILRVLAISALLVAAPIGAASAADAAVNAPLSPTVFSWTGFYVGGNVGYGWGRTSNDWNFFSPNTIPIIPGGAVCPPTGYAFCASGSDSNKLNGAIGGLQAGYNWQATPYLLGIEADIQGSGQKGDNQLNSLAASNLGLVTYPLSGPYTEQIAWLGTFRGRLGYTFNRWLVYVTGGLAIGEVKMTGSATTTGTGAGGSCTVCALGSWNNNDSRAGWTLGAGWEAAIFNNWSLKVEYLHVDLGRMTTTFTIPPGSICNASPACNPFGTGNGSISTRITDEIVRVGLNYQFR